MTAAKREASPRRAARHDPRAEPESPPPAGVVEEMAPPVRRDPRAEPDSLPPAPAASAPPPAAPAPPPPEEPAPPEPPPPDPRFAELEPLIARNAWGEVAQRLRPDGEAGALPPALALVFALARRESGGEGDSAGATQLAIQSMAALVGVQPHSHTAVLLAKRHSHERLARELKGRPMWDRTRTALPRLLDRPRCLLRQAPAGWRQRPAPPPRLSAAIIVVGILVGAAVGWFVNFGSLRFF